MPLSDQSTPSLTPSPSRSPSPTPPVQPDHFYSPDSDAHRLSPSPDVSSRAWFSPDDDPLATKGIPVFKPTMDEFSDFEAYMARVECWGMRSGIIKIVPPKEWSDALPSVLPQLGAIRIRSPIEQHMLGRSGLYRQQNIEKRKAISVREWAELCAKEDFRAPAVHEVGLKAVGEQGLDKRRRSKRRAGTAKTEAEEVIVKEEEIEQESRLVTAPTTEAEADADLEAESNNEDGEDKSSTPATRKRRVQTRAEREIALAKRAELDAAFLETFDPATAWLPHNMTPADYTPGFCSTLERRYWRNCGLGRPPWYGADTAGSLFTDETTSWNVSCLPSTLARLLPVSMNGLPGVNTPYLYFGMWRATFAWHVEDMDLLSINYIHFGAPKFWYAVPQARAVQLENTLRSLFPSDVARCRQFLRHKSFLASPTLLAQSSCKPNTLVQHAGEFVVTYPHGYHAGFNLGFNCAESVNFALDSWLDIGRKAQACGCIGDSVRIDVDALLREREEENLQASTQRSKKSKSECGADSKFKSSQKRKSDYAGPSRAKKRKVKVEPTDSGIDGGAGPSTSTATIRQKILLKVPKDLGPFPCCLCVSRELAGLLRVHDPPSAWSGYQNYTPKDASGRLVWHAHESCAMVVPETWVDEVADGAGQVEKVVFGVDAIVKGRWALKCTSCQKSRAKAHGAPIQCTKGKCPKAFHVSCARDGGSESRVHFAILREVEKEVVLNELSPSSSVEPVADLTIANVLPSACDSTAIDPALLITPPTLSDISPDPTVPAVPLHLQASPQPNVIKTIKKIEYELLCTQHNPAVAATKRANKLDRVRNELRILPAMSRIKLRVSAGVFEVSLVSVNEERNTVEVIWDDGIKREFKWSSLVWGKMEGQTVGQKPAIAAPPQEQELHSTSFIRMKISGYSSSSKTPTPMPDVQAARQGVFTSEPNGTVSQPYSPYPTPSCGQFQYGTGTYSYYSHPPDKPVAGSSTTPHAPVPQLYAVAGPSLYGAPPYYGYPPGVYPPTPVPQQAYAPPNYSMFSSNTSAAPFTQAFQQTIASSVALLPPRTGLTGAAPTPTPPPTQQTPPPPVPATDASTPTPEKVDPTVTEELEASFSAADVSRSALSPDVLQAVEELQALSSLEPAKLQEVLNARPALRDAVRVLLAHQAMQQPFQPT